MARIILKSPYLKPGQNAHLQNYFRYIATRHGVERVKSPEDREPVTEHQAAVITELLQKYPDVKELYEYEDYRSAPTQENAGELILRIAESHPQLFNSRKGYLRYIANRPRVEKLSYHGLFSSTDVLVDLEKVMADIEGYPGNVWTHIISLRREDASRLGYDKAAAWRALLQKNQIQIAAAMKIQPDNFRWYAAFHNEDHHPHVHMVAYSSNPKEAYLSKRGIASIKSLLAKDIFKDDLMNIYQKETAARDELRRGGDDFIKNMAAQMNSGFTPNPLLESMLRQLAERLARTKGKKVYGYLSSNTKDLVNAIVDVLERDEKISSLYETWYQQKNEVLRTYKDHLPERVPLSQNIEFKTVRNAVISAALILTDLPEPAGQEDTEDITPEAQHDAPKKDKRYPWTETYLAARSALYGTPHDSEAAFKLMCQEAQKGNPLAMHDLAKMHLDGLGCTVDGEAAQRWFKKALDGFRQLERSKEKNDYWQYRIGKMYSMGYGTEQDYKTAASWYEEAASQENPFAAYALGSLYLRGQGLQQDDVKAHDLFVVAAEHKKKPNAYAMYELGKMYRDGRGTEADLAQSESWFSYAYSNFASLEKTMPDDKLRYRLGHMTLNGIGTEKDINKAYEYLKEAVEQKNKDAAYLYGQLCLNPECTGFNPERGLFHLKQAAQNGNLNAAYLIGKTYAKGEFVPKHVTAALPYLEMAAENPYALYLLGKLYLYGDGVEQDTETAFRYLTEAANYGHPYAPILLDKISNPTTVKPELLSPGLLLVRQVCGIFENRLNSDTASPRLDSKLRWKIAEKKLAHGQKLE